MATIVTRITNYKPCGDCEGNGKHEVELDKGAAHALGVVSGRAVQHIQCVRCFGAGKLLESEKLVSETRSWWK